MCRRDAESASERPCLRSGRRACTCLENFLSFSPPSHFVRHGKQAGLSRLLSLRPTGVAFRLESPRFELRRKRLSGGNDAEELNTCMRRLRATKPRPCNEVKRLGAGEETNLLFTEIISMRSGWVGGKKAEKTLKAGVGSEPPKTNQPYARLPQVFVIP